MSNSTLAALWRVSSSLQVLAMLSVGLLTVALGVTLGLSLAGLIPGPSITLTLSNGAAYQIGALIHGLAFLISLLLVAYMPANWRMRRLEAGHRSFRIGMEDVTRAYQVAHAADRADQFTMHAEYDAVRERLEFLAHHEDLGHLEPEILEVAAQMSRVSEDLAVTYSDKAVERAKSFLAERQSEVARMEERIERALEASRELRLLHDRVSMDEDVAASRRTQLKAELDQLVADIGLSEETAAPQPAVVRLIPPVRRADVAAE